MKRIIVLSALGAVCFYASAGGIAEDKRNCISSGGTPIETASLGVGCLAPDPVLDAMVLRPRHRGVTRPVPGGTWNAARSIFRGQTGAYQSQFTHTTVTSKDGSVRRFYTNKNTGEKIYK